METKMEEGLDMYEFIKELFPICRSITGDGVRETLAIIKKHLPQLNIHEIPSGTQCFDWTIPEEWNIKDAYVEDPNGQRIIDFKKNNLHVVSYSIPVNKTLTLEELDQHLYSLPGQPDVIPYATSYYDRKWGFCLSHNQRQGLKKGLYKVVIDSQLKPGHLTYADLLIPGQEKEEILLSTYVCHPSLANNELSGPAVTTFLGKWLSSYKNRYTYRLVFVPETIGAVAYLSRHIEQMKERTVAGFQLTCVGDNRTYCFIPSRKGNTLADRVTLHELNHKVKDFNQYTFLDRGSDQRQYCSPGVDLPVISVTRSMHSRYPEYHTSLDNLSFISPEGLQGAFNVYQNCLKILENNYSYHLTTIGEPQLGKRNLRPSLGMKNFPYQGRQLSNILAYSDGTLDLIGLADTIGAYALDLLPIISRLQEEGLLRKANSKS